MPSRVREYDNGIRSTGKPDFKWWIASWTRVWICLIDFDDNAS